MTDYELDPLARRRVLYRLLQLLMLILMGISFFIAALAQPMFNSNELGWEALGVMLVALLAFWWTGHQADRRN